MATREEEHSTRGRANALRAVLSGKLPPSELTSRRMADVMSLCVSCKACKAECPSSVDMGKIKTEFLAQYQAVNGIPLRSRLFAHIGTLNRLSSPFAPLANWLLRSRPTRYAASRFLGIAPERQLPLFAHQSFLHWFYKRPQRPAQPDNQRVVLLNDTYNTYNYPHVLIAATEVLEAAGFTVILPGHTCVGRPALSKGMVTQARRYAVETLAKLQPLIEEGLPVICLEPSDVSAIRDDYQSLLPKDARVAVVARQTMTFEEFIAQLADSGQLQPVFKQTSRRVLLHGHCHQKALIGMQPTKRVLALLGYAVVEVDSGCCGMAGSFGYEAEHYAVSLKMAERRLLPAVREQDDDVLIVANGVSCREQINHSTGRAARHSAELLQMALIDSKRTPLVQ